jgi:surface protein
VIDDFRFSPDNSPAVVATATATAGVVAAAAAVVVDGNRVSSISRKDDDAKILSVKYNPFIPRKLAFYDSESDVDVDHGGITQSLFIENTIWPADRSYRPPIKNSLRGKTEDDMAKARSLDTKLMNDPSADVGILDKGFSPINGDVITITGGDRQVNDARALYPLNLSTRSGSEDFSCDACAYQAPLPADAYIQDLYDACYGNNTVDTCPGDIRCWNTSQIKDMSSAFENRGNFNAPLKCWDVSSAQNMTFMFNKAYAFNQHIGDWQTSSLLDMRAMFAFASSFNTPLGQWSTSKVQSMRGTFTYAYSFNQTVDEWDVASVTTMRGMFYRARNFNQPLDSWQTGSVESMRAMFTRAYDFDKLIDEWDVSSVTDMFYMFTQASSFNQCLSTWADKTDENVDTGKMLKNSGCPNTEDPDPEFAPWCQGDEDECFAPSASPSDSPSSSPSIDCTDNPDFQLFGVAKKTCEWVGQNTDTRCSKKGVSEACPATCNSECPCFELCGPRSQRPIISDTNIRTSLFKCMNDISSAICPFPNIEIQCWETSEVTNMKYLFDYSYSFNEPLGCWDVSSVVTMQNMFYYARSFNQNINRWDVSSVENMSDMFTSDYAFNQPLSDWKMSSVKQMYGMFDNARDFNQPIGGWDVSSVSTMNYLFSDAKAFNQAIDEWDVSSVEEMYYMFERAYDFNQPIDEWDVSSVADMSRMFISAVSFNQCLSTWADKTDENVRTVGMLVASGCPNTYSPDPEVAPWCQGDKDECFAPSASPSESPSSRPTINCSDDPDFQLFGVAKKDL